MDSGKSEAGIGAGVGGGGGAAAAIGGGSIEELKGRGLLYSF